MCNSIYSDTTSNFPVEVFNSLAERPAHLRTRAEWQRKGRKVIDKIKPVAKVKVSYRFDPMGLFVIDQTRPYNFTPRTSAIDDYWRTFVRDHNKGAYIWWCAKGGGWRTVGSDDVPHHLKRRQIMQHFQAEEVFGVRGGTRTCFGAIDLDLHAGDKRIFMEMFRVLLSAIHGQENWHYSISAGGLHLINVFRGCTWTCGATGWRMFCGNWTNSIPNWRNRQVAKA